MLTFIKMIDTIIALTQDTGKGEDKDVQVSLMESEDRPMLSAREKQRLSLEERIRARKSVVQDTNQKQKDLELKSMRYELEMLQSRLVAITEEKAIVELKAHE